VVSEERSSTDLEDTEKEELVQGIEVQHQCASKCDKRMPLVAGTVLYTSIASCFGERNSKKVD
jgi:hypothetical protein